MAESLSRKTGRPSNWGTDTVTKRGVRRRKSKNWKENRKNYREHKSDYRQYARKRARLMKTNKKFNAAQKAREFELELLKDKSIGGFGLPESAAAKYSAQYERQLRKSKEAGTAFKRQLLKMLRGADDKQDSLRAAASMSSVDFESLSASPGRKPKAAGIGFKEMKSAIRAAASKQVGRIKKLYQKAKDSGNKDVIVKNLTAIQDIKAKMLSNAKKSWENWVAAGEKKNSKFGRPRKATAILLSIDKQLKQVAKNKKRLASTKQTPNLHRRGRPAYFTVTEEEIGLGRGRGRPAGDSKKTNSKTTGAKAGKTSSRTADAPYGLKKDGTPKSKPGRKSNAARLQSRIPNKPILTIDADIANFAPYGFKKDGTPKARPGRKANPNAKSATKSSKGGKTSSRTSTTNPRHSFDRGGYEKTSGGLFVPRAFSSVNSLRAKRRSDKGRISTKRPLSKKI